MGRWLAGPSIHILSSRLDPLPSGVTTNVQTRGIGQRGNQDLFDCLGGRIVPSEDFLRHHKWTVVLLVVRQSIIARSLQESYDWCQELHHRVVDSGQPLLCRKSSHKTTPRTVTYVSRSSSSVQSLPPCSPAPA